MCRVVGGAVEQAHWALPVLRAAFRFCFVSLWPIWVACGCLGRFSRSWPAGRDAHATVATAASTRQPLLLLPLVLLLHLLHLLLRFLPSGSPLRHPDLYLSGLLWTTGKFGSVSLSLSLSLSLKKKKNHHPKSKRRRHRLSFLNKIAPKSGCFVSVVVRFLYSHFDLDCGPKKNKTNS